MNQFEVLNRLPEYLDGQLLGSERDWVEAQIQADPILAEKVRRYRKIADRIAKLPRYSIPVQWQVQDDLEGSKKKKKVKSSGPPIVIRRTSRRRWIARTLVETAALSTVVLLVLASISRLRNIEKNRDQNGSVLKSAGLDLNQLMPVSPGQDAGLDEGDTDQDQERAAPPIDMKSLKVGPGEIWRIHVKTGSPRDLRNQIIGRLEKFGITQANAVEAPGGIQFDLMVASEKVVPIKAMIEELAPVTKQKTFDIAWFKTRSRTPIPSGQTRVILWLSQM